MAAIAPLATADHADWLGLWGGYLAFYASDLDDSVTAATFVRLTDPDADIHGAIARDEHGRAVGIVHWLTHSATWTTTSYCYLEDLFVAPDARGHGIGRALIEHVRDWARRRGSAKVYWLTSESNTTAHALYDRVASRTGMIQYQITLG